MYFLCYSVDVVLPITAMLVNLEPSRLVQGLCCTLKPGDGAVDVPGGCVVNGLGNFFPILRFWIFGFHGSVLVVSLFFFFNFEIFQTSFLFPSPSEERIFDFELLGLWNASSLLHNVASKFPKLNVCNSQRFYGCCVEPTTWHSPGRSHFRSVTAVKSWEWIKCMFSRQTKNASLITARFGAP